MNNATGAEVSAIQSGFLSNSVNIRGSKLNTKI